MLVFSVAPRSSANKTPAGVRYLIRWLGNRTAQEPLQTSSTASTARLLTFLCSPIYMEQLE